jgi:hypothetical protein
MWLKPNLPRGAETLIRDLTDTSGSRSTLNVLFKVNGSCAFRRVSGSTSSDIACSVKKPQASLLPRLLRFLLECCSMSNKLIIFFSDIQPNACKALCAIYLCVDRFSGFQDTCQLIHQGNRRYNGLLTMSLEELLGYSIVNEK